MAIPQSDPYLLKSDEILEAPSRLGQKLRFLGPGFILSASVVGSGELIATTTLGAKAGFVTLWVILVSCLVKIVLQLEFGRQSITRGVTSMNLMDQMPGPRFGKKQVSWAAWAWLVNLDHTYLVDERLDVGTSRVEPHGHGWPITANIVDWHWKKKGGQEKL